MKFQQIGLIAEKILTLSSKQEWVKRVPRDLPKKREAEQRIWVDRFGAVMAIGEDFEAAKKAESYPVTVYSLCRAAEIVDYEI